MLGRLYRGFLLFVLNYKNTRLLVCMQQLFRTPWLSSAGRFCTHCTSCSGRHDRPWVVMVDPMIYDVVRYLGHLNDKNTSFNLHATVVQNSLISQFGTLLHAPHVSFWAPQ
jgi:hypothetical protein